MNKFYLLLLSSLVLSTTACMKKYEKLPNDTTIPTEFTELKVGTEFDWTAAVPLVVQVNVTDNSGKNINTDGLVLQLLDQDYNRIKTDIAKNGSLTFEAKIPASVTKTFVFIPATGNIVEIPVIEGTQNLQLTTEPVVESGGKPAKNTFYGRPAAGPDCNSGCTTTYNTNQSNLEIPVGSTVCLTGNIKVTNIKFKGAGTLRICGTADISNFDYEGNGIADIIVTESGVLTTSILKSNNTNQRFTNYGTANLNNNLGLNGYFTNYGIATIKDDININGSSVFLNTGTIDVNGTISNNNTFTNSGSITVKKDFRHNNGTFTNDGTMIIDGLFSSNKAAVNNKTITIKGDFNNNSGAFTNNGGLYVTGDFSQNTTLNNGAGSYISIGKEFKANSGRINMGNLSMISAKDYTMNGVNIYVSSEGAVIKVVNKLIINSGSVSGTLDICDSKNPATASTRFGPNVKYCNSGIYIPKNEYNTEGFGVPTVIDTDGDKIEDKSDAFPTDAARAFLEMEPYIGYKVTAFEDLWPSKGDYDFNDVVIKSRSRIVFNAKRDLVEMETEYIFSALGGSLPKGLGVQMLSFTIAGGKFSYTQPNIKPFIKSIETLKGRATARLSAKATNAIILTDNISAVTTPYYSNDEETQFSRKPDTIAFRVNFNSGTAALGNLLTDCYLMLNKENSVGIEVPVEIHCADRPATADADISLFGLRDDTSNPVAGRFYKSGNNLPWAIEIYPGKTDFAHPTRKFSILQAYPNFGKWATSNGLEAKDWYLTPDPAFIFMLK